MIVGHQIHQIVNVERSSFIICSDRILINHGEGVGQFDFRERVYRPNLYKDGVATVYSGNFFSIVQMSTSKTLFYDYSDNIIAERPFIAATIDNLPVLETKDFIYPVIFLNNDFATQYNGRISKKDFVLEATQKFSTDLKAIHLTLNDERFIYTSFDAIIGSNFQSETLWKAHFSELIGSENAYLNSKVFEYDKMLLLAINSQTSGTPGIYFLDSTSGVVIDYIAGNYYGIAAGELKIYTSKYENLLSIIDPSSRSIETWDANHFLKINGFYTLNNTQNIVKENRLYFTQNIGAENAKLGVLDLDTKSLIYKHEFSQEHGAIGDLNVAGQNIVIHTQDKTLHVLTLNQEE